MQRIQQYKNNITVFIIALFSIVTLTKALHYFVETHHNSHVVHCDTHCGKQPHFHKGNNIEDEHHCFICDFVISEAIFPNKIDFKLNNFVAHYIYIFNYKADKKTTYEAIFLTRGPPSTISI